MKLKIYNERQKNHKDKGIHKNYIANYYVFFLKKKQNRVLSRLLLNICLVGYFYCICIQKLQVPSVPNLAVKSVFYLLLEHLGVLSDQVSHLWNLLGSLTLRIWQQNTTNCGEFFNFSLRFRYWDEGLLRVRIVKPWHSTHSAPLDTRRNYTYSNNLKHYWNKL